jgi:phage shock protein PspC (stress-responsive transcriptional regulator)
MTCVRCSKEIEDQSMFCRFCGAAVGRGDTAARRLTRIPADGKLGGVCAGIAAYLNADVTLVRLAWVILSIVPGAVIGGVIAYAAAWLLMPEASGGERLVVPAGRRLARSATDRKIGGVCGGVAEYVGLDSTIVRLATVILAIYPGAVVCGVLVYLVAWFIIPPPPPAPMHAAPAPL